MRFWYFVVFWDLSNMNGTIWFGFLTFSSLLLKSHFNQIIMCKSIHLAAKFIHISNSICMYILNHIHMHIFHAKPYVYWIHYSCIYCMSSQCMCWMLYQCICYILYQYNFEVSKLIICLSLQLSVCVLLIPMIFQLDDNSEHVAH